LKPDSAAEIIELLGLEPLKIEGGWYCELWRSKRNLNADILGEPYCSARSLGTSIYYLLTPETFSAIHRLPSDEIFHFYLGDTVRMLQLLPDGEGKVLELGTDIAAGQRPQVVVPSNVWQGCRLTEGGRFALMGTTVIPGFEFEDFTSGNRMDLIQQYPSYEKQITQLTL
jgi:predicted cupin superfamily sugar epimerase